MRTKYSIKNVSIGVFSQIIIALLGFISRKVFLDSLGTEYLGVNGLMTNVLAAMVLIESGIGTSIVYNLYKPLANNDTEKVTALVQIYKKAYFIIAALLGLFSMGLYPLLNYIMKDGESISHLNIIFFIFVIKNIISYLNAHKISLINADQRGYLIARVNLLFQMGTIILRILILIFTNDYILYLLVELILFTLQNIINGKIVYKRYPYLNTKKKYMIDHSTKQNLKINVKAMFLHSIGGYLVFGTDNILMSSFVGLASVGLYSNYSMITQQVAALLTPILGGIGASIGNLIATENAEKKYSIFKISFFVNFWLYSLSVIFLYNLLEPFISWWIGKDYLLDKLTFIFILINFYLLGMRSAISTFKIKSGLFVQDKFAPVIEGAINLGASLILMKYFGLAGIFIGTTISTILTVLWTQPFIVYKLVFQKSVLRYFYLYGFYAMLTFLGCILSQKLCGILVEGDTFISLLQKGLICLFVPNIVYVILFLKTKEYRYIYNTVLSNLVFFNKKKQFKEV
ncbi:lipopolysaccharide biosynthesis protein [Falsibacillus pallidus]|uniref:O-antigen/teichoic acid export membrane protein n=1 Tax=Falsibacillus pallidus TaxID=493781 RepID=A0A370GUW5_9BACI|nr:oligosaccharide flippase family protein [Falsibacillus pallidus]RDI45723.1 O-antigen/teichoic acid export membrane protein [Falsibacillus pallidus]